MSSSIRDISGLSLEECLNCQGKFVDPTFNLEQVNTFEYCRRINRDDIVYRHVAEVGFGNELKLFQPSTSSYSIRQGTLPDCFFITACSVLANRSEILKKLFITQEYNEKGVYCLQFYQQGEWKHVIVDDIVPCSKSTGAPAFAMSTNSVEIWPYIIEKAYAKFYGSYDALNGGNVSEALMDITGCPVEDFNLEKVEIQNSLKSGGMWQDLRSWIKKKYLLACSYCTDEDISSFNENQNGIINNHAYAVLNIHELGTTRYILIHNPHGTIQKTVPKSDKLKKLPEVESGSMWVLLADFTKFFNRLYCCKLIDLPESSTRRIESEWTVETSGGCSTFNSFKNNPKFRLETANSTGTIFLTLQQECQRSEKKKQGLQITYPQIGITIVQLPKDTPYPCLTPNNYQIIGKTGFWNKREVSVELKVSGIKQGDYVYIIPSTYYPNTPGKFKLLWTTSVDGNAVPKIEEEKSEFKRVEYMGSWTNCGGPTSSSSFYSQPSLVLHVPESTTAYIFLQQLKKNSVQVNKGIGLYILHDIDSLKSITSLTSPMVYDKCAYSNHEEISKSFRFKSAGEYLIVPCLHKLGSGEFKLTILSKTTEFKLTDPPATVDTGKSPVKPSSTSVTRTTTVTKRSPSQTKITTKSKASSRSTTAATSTLTRLNPVKSTRVKQPNIVDDMRQGRAQKGRIASLYANLE